MKAKDLYNVAIYLRLSRDDEGSSGKTESNSISSQRDLIRSFVRRHEDMEIFDIYVDDGYTGTNFDRPEFKRMMEDIHAGQVDCVIVKDLSRFGRDSTEAGRLILKTFPALNVRFIALTDQFDSLTADVNETSLMVPVKNFINDSYCRDISVKIRSHQRIKWEKGAFIGSFTVYGYRKERENRNRLVPDEYAAQIVRNIFAWKLDGMSNFAIAEQLNRMGILSPMEYKKSKGEKYSTSFSAGIKAAWSAVAVKRILVNEIYIGHMEQGKSEKVSYKVKKCKLKPKDEWVRVEDTHEAVVSREDFLNVKRLLAIDCRASGGTKKAHMFSGLLFCGDCGRVMTRRICRYRSGEKVRFICSTRNVGQGCTMHGIEEEALKAAVLTGLKSQMALLSDKARVLAQLDKLEVSFEEIRQFDQEIIRLVKEQEQYQSLRSGLYEDLKSGVITQEDFRSFRKIYEEKYAKTQEAITAQERMIQACFKSGVASGIRLERFKEALELTELTRDALVAFIGKILVYEDKRICVELNAKELFSKMIMIAEYADRKEGDRPFGNRESGREAV